MTSPWNAERYDYLQHAWWVDLPIDEIMDELRLIKGPPFNRSPEQVRDYAEFHGFTCHDGKKKCIALPNPWWEARCDYFAQAWLAGVPVEEILEKLKHMNGPRFHLSTKELQERAVDLGLTPRVEEESAWTPHRDFCLGVAWRHGWPLSKVRRVLWDADGPPFQASEEQIAERAKALGLIHLLERR